MGRALCQDEVAGARPAAGASRYLKRHAHGVAELRYISSAKIPRVRGAEQAGAAGHS